MPGGHAQRAVQERHGQQALELFDWLQSLPPNHELAPLADVFSYTTGQHWTVQWSCFRY